MRVSSGAHAETTLTLTHIPTGETRVYTIKAKFYTLD
jgi:hypothetical protein